MPEPSHVLLLHAHARTPASMAPLARRLRAAGHTPFALPYPSRSATVAACAHAVVAQLRARFGGDPPPLCVVGHSMGGVVYRALRDAEPSLRIRRGVTLGSPLRGAVAARSLPRSAVLSAWLGPAMAEFGVASGAPEPSLPAPTLCIAGIRSLPFYPGALLLRASGLRGPNDSTVLVEEALSEHADQTLEVDVVHTFLPSSPAVGEAVEAYLAPALRDR